MIFTKLRYRNILSTGNQWTEIALNKNKTTLVVGANGSGKSTILDAISFALFNKPFRSDFNKPQLVNSINGKGLIVEIEFHIGRKEFTIRRGIKPAIFEVYEDDKLLNQDASVYDYQSYLEKNILKVNHRSFCQVVILGSANYTPFMKLDAKFRREVVEDILDLKNILIDEQPAAYKEAAGQSDIASNQSEKKLLTQRIELIKQHTEEITATNNQLIVDKKERIKEAFGSIDTCTREIENSTLLINDAKKKIEDDIMKQMLQSDLNHLKFKLETKVSNLSKGISFFEENETCPTCSQAIDQEFKCDTIVKKKISLDEASYALVQVNAKLGNVNKRLAKINEDKEGIADLKLSINIHQSDITHLQKYIGELESEIQLIESHNKKIDREELIRLNFQIGDINLRYNMLIKRKNLLEMAGILLKDSGIKSKIIKQYIPIINKLINKYLGMLDFFVQFEINERFEETIRSRFRDEFTYGSFSEGEKFRINLAILFTWRSVAKLRNSISTNILFLDEIFDSSLDLSGTEEFLKIINHTEADNIFIISHKVDQLYDKFENVIVFQKTKNFSRIVSV